MYFKTAAICVVVFITALLIGYVVDRLEKHMNKSFDNTNTTLGFLMINSFFVFFVSLCLGIWNL